MTATQIYKAQNGLVAIEVESTPAKGGWSVERTYGGYTGDSYYRFRVNSTIAGIPTSDRNVLSYTVDLDRSGRYFLSLRSLRAKEDRITTADQENDYWVRVNGGDWVKVRFGGAFGEWNWATQRNTTGQHATLENTFYDLQTGLNTIEIAGRSSNVMLDRIHLSRNSFNRDATVPPSQIISTVPDPVDPDPVDPTPVDPTPVDPTPVEPTALTIEAEAFTSRNGYGVQTISPELTVARIRATVPSGESAETSTAFTGESGLYTVQVKYLDESDGAGQLSLFVNGTLVETLQLNQTTSDTTGLPVSTWSVKSGEAIAIAKGDQIKFVGVRDLEEFARIDSISFTPAAAPDPVDPTPVDPTPVDPTPVDPTPVEPDPVELTALTIEAEAFTSRNGYGIQAISPELTVARIRATVPSGESAETSTAFTGESGLYSIQVKYLDESDGEGQLSLFVGGTLVETLQLNQTTSNTTGLPVSTWNVNGGLPIAIAKGDQIKFVGVRDLEEFARIDSITFIPATAVEPEPTDPTPVPPTPVDPAPNALDPSAGAASVLQVSGTNLLTVSSAIAKQTVKFTVLEPSQVGPVEVGFFEVDDAQGTIGGAKPGDAGYTTAALANAKTVFSTLGDLDIQGLDLSRVLSLLGGQSYGFFVTQNGTVDSVLGGTGGQVTFASSLFGLGAGEALSFSYLENEGAYLLDWDVNRDGVFGDFRFKVELFDEAGMPLGSDLQGGQESELLDLRGLSGPVQLDMVVYREALNNNQLGFYRVENTQGTVLDEFGNALNPGDEGYIRAAVRQWAGQAGIAPDNLGTLSTSLTVSGGQILVPFLISGGSVEQLLDGDVANDPSVFFPFLKANPGMVDHVKLLGNNTFAFEDSIGGGDFDYDDLVVKINVQPVA